MHRDFYGSPPIGPGAMQGFGFGFGFGGHCDGRPAFSEFPTTGEGVYAATLLLRTLIPVMYLI